MLILSVCACKLSHFFFLKISYLCPKIGSKVNLAEKEGPIAVRVFRSLQLVSM